MKSTGFISVVAATLSAGLFAGEQNDFALSGGWLPPEPPAGLSSDFSGRPPEPPDGFMHGRGGDRQGDRRGMRGSRKGMRGSRQGGPSGNMRGPGGMRGDDPSDPSIYSGVETVSAKSASFENVSFDSSSGKNTAPMYVKDAGKAKIAGGRLTSSVSGANAVLVIGKGSEADVSDLVIETTKDSSRGLYAFQGGVIRAKNVKISTLGAHCAAMATDRGEGTVSVDGATLNTAGDGSPCIYSTGVLEARNSNGRATGSEAMVIEGRNSILLENSSLAGERKCGAMLYQSFSGDAREGVAKLVMRNSSLSAAQGPLFFITNTRAEIDLSGCTLSGAKGEALLSAKAGRWGRSGQNGGKVTLKAAGQVLEGDIEADAVSEVVLEFGEGTVFTGSINTAKTAKSVTLKIAKGAKVVLTGDSCVTRLDNEDGSGGNMVKGGYTLAVSP
ncbi:MAG: hypothetical protein K6F50_00850 [Kiritimatiellae bacterium]|nr:hypothetical protein [Kiritimatiellia bacterium]